MVPKLPMELLHRSSNAPPNSKNNLARCNQVLNDSRVESLHVWLPHLGNTNANRDTTDACMFLHIHRCNARQREQNRIGLL